MLEPDSKERFVIAVPGAALEDLKERLNRIRWPNEPEGSPWQYGANLGYMREVADYWLHRYDWRQWEAVLNRWPNYLTEIGGQKIHFIMERGSGNNPLPLVITHGWPGSVVEFIDVIDALAHPERHGGNAADSFTVIAPSLPGFGFSPSPRGPLTAHEIAHLWHQLMVDKLGCKRYVAQGGDWGAIVTSWLGLDFPQNLAAIHTSLCALHPQVKDGDADPLEPSERHYVAERQRRFGPESAYVAIQGTKPQTLAYGLTDSPIGVAAWILEKFHGWTQPGPDGKPPISIDHLLTNVMLYWLNGINGANWVYRNIVDGSAMSLPRGRRVEVPTGMMLCHGDLIEPPPDRWIRRSYNLVHRTDIEGVGHFPSLEASQRFVHEVRSFFAAHAR